MFKWVWNLFWDYIPSKRVSLIVALEGWRLLCLLFIQKKNFERIFFIFKIVYSPFIPTLFHFRSPKSITNPATSKHTPPSIPHPPHPTLISKSKLVISKLSSTAIHFSKPSPPSQKHTNFIHKHSLWHISKKISIPIQTVPNPVQHILSITNTPHHTTSCRDSCLARVGIPGWCLPSQILSSLFWDVFLHIYETPLQHLLFSWKPIGMFSVLVGDWVIWSLDLVRLYPTVIVGINHGSPCHCGQPALWF